MSCRRLAALLVLLSTTALPTLAVPLADYVGQYVLRLGARNFVVLNLQKVGSTLTGTLSRPRHSSLGSSFSNISADVITELIASAALEGDDLRINAKYPADPSDTDAFDLTLLPSGSASLKPFEIPIDPWTLNRVPASPILSVATDWDPPRTYHPNDTEQSNPEVQRIMDEDSESTSVPEYVSR